jgi:hypothetical protein
VLASDHMLCPAADGRAHREHVAGGGALRSALAGCQAEMLYPSFLLSRGLLRVQIGEM